MTQHACSQSTVRRNGTKSEYQRAYIALGSNVGDRLEMIERACLALDDDPDIRLLRTSSLYETAPMYVEDQAVFLNGACEIDTRLPPFELLDRLQAIENAMGRVKKIDKGPRNIDLDIILYGKEIITSNRLIIPHKLMLEREFVLRPLCDIIPDDLMPNQNNTLSDYLDALPPSSPPISTYTPLTRSLSLRALDVDRPTHVMSILNTTPDSFSDGGVNSPSDTTALLSTLKAHIAAGATIIDIGGQSSRPNAPDISAAEEIARVLPAIRLAQTLPEVAAGTVALSIDTYRAPVADAAITAGAHIVNDISAGRLDPDMLRTVAHLRCPVVLMHMRGTPATMAHPPQTTYPPGALLETIAEELCARVAEAEAAGIPRWRLILDPGIGFAKTAQQNLELLRRFAELRRARGLRGLPWLVGSSRKGFLGRLAGVAEARDRVGASAAAVAAAVAGGADVVRVHDVEVSRQVVRVSEGIWRHGVV